MAKYSLQLVNLINRALETDFQETKQLSCAVKLAEVFDECLNDDVKTPVLRKLLFYHLKQPKVQTEDDARNVAKMCTILAKYTNSMDPVEFMNSMLITYNKYWSFYDVFGRFLLQHNRAVDVQKLLEDCLINCNLSKDELLENISADLKPFLESEEHTTQLFTDRDLSADLNSQSFFVGTPRVRREDLMLPEYGVALPHLVEKPHKSLGGAAAIVGYQLALHLSKLPAGTSLTAHRVVFDSTIDENADFDSQFDVSILYICTSTRRRIPATSLSPKMAFLDCIHHLLFGVPLKTLVAQSRRYITSKIETVWVDAEFWSDLFPDFLNSADQNVDWETLANDLRLSIEERCMVPIFEENYKSGISEFNRLFKEH